MAMRGREGENENMLILAPLLPASPWGSLPNQQQVGGWVGGLLLLTYLP